MCHSQVKREKREFQTVIVNQASIVSGGLHQRIMRKEFQSLIAELKSLTGGTERGGISGIMTQLFDFFFYTACRVRLRPLPNLHPPQLFQENQVHIFASTPLRLPYAVVTKLRNKHVSRKTQQRKRETEYYKRFVFLVTHKYSRTSPLQKQ